MSEEPVGKLCIDFAYMFQNFANQYHGDADPWCTIQPGTFLEFLDVLFSLEADLMLLASLCREIARVKIVVKPLAPKFF